MGSDNQGRHIEPMKPRTTYDFPVDKIYRRDSRDMKEVPDETVSLVVCSPPYNVRKPYSNHNDDMDLDDYKELLLAVWRECQRVLRPGGRLCVNVAGVWRQPYLPLHAIIWQQLVDELQFLMRGEIIWDKGASVGVSTAWGSFTSPSNPTLRDVHEHVVVAAKGPARLAPSHDTISVFSKDDLRLRNVSGLEPNIDNEDFVEWTRSVWTLPTESSARVGHPAPFPVELPRRLILLYTYPGDLVLDPFVGSGSSCVAARITDRHYVGYDIDAKYARLARQRVRQAGKQLTMPGFSASMKRNGQRPRRKVVLRMGATTLVGSSDVRDREITVAICNGEVEIGIRSATDTRAESARQKKPDVQKQNLKASLSPDEARNLAESLTASAELVADDGETDEAP